MKEKYSDQVPKYVYRRSLDTPDVFTLWLSAVYSVIHCKLSCTLLKISLRLREVWEGHADGWQEK